MWTVDRLFAEIKKDEAYYQKSGGGITVSGGEATMQLPFLLKFLKMCKEAKIQTAIETSGYYSQDTLEKLVPLIDLLMFDLKIMDSSLHKRYCGVPNDRILMNAIWIAHHYKSTSNQFWIRTPIIPQYTATDENIISIAKFIVEQMENKIDRWDLLAFNNLAQSKYDRMDREWTLKGSPLLTDDEMNHFKAIATKIGV